MNVSWELQALSVRSLRQSESGNHIASYYSAVQRIEMVFHLPKIPELAASV